MPLSKEKKSKYFGKMVGFLIQFSKVIIVGIDNVGSYQMQQIRMALRGEAEVLMGKNTLMRKVITDFVKKHKGHPIANLLPHLEGNIGLVFTNSDLKHVRDVIIENKVPAPARVGALTPCDVIVPKGPTGCDPSQTNFFQVLQIATKIVKGQIEIVSDVTILKKGDKVRDSEAALLTKLDIKPFSYGMSLKLIYDSGSMFSPDVLDLTEEHFSARFLDAVQRVAALAISVGIPTQASLPHSVSHAFKTLLAITIQCDNYTFPQATAAKTALAAIH